MHQIVQTVQFVMIILDYLVIIIDALVSRRDFSGQILRINAVYISSLFDLIFFFKYFSFKSKFWDIIHHVQINHSVNLVLDSLVQISVLLASVPQALLILMDHIVVIHFKY